MSEPTSAKKSFGIPNDAWENIRTGGYDRNYSLLPRATALKAVGIDRDSLLVGFADRFAAKVSDEFVVSTRNDFVNIRFGIRQADFAGAVRAAHSESKDSYSDDGPFSESTKTLHQCSFRPRFPRKQETCRR
jgi:hypothetical protein